MAKYRVKKKLMHSFHVLACTGIHLHYIHTYIFRICGCTRLNSFDVELTSYLQNIARKKADPSVWSILHSLYGRSNILLTKILRLCVAGLSPDFMSKRMLTVSVECGGALCECTQNIDGIALYADDFASNLL